VLWDYLAHCKYKWWAFVSVVMDFQGFTKCTKFLEQRSDYYFLKNTSSMWFVKILELRKVTRWQTCVTIAMCSIKKSGGTPIVLTIVCLYM